MNTYKCNGLTLDLSTPKVMSIVNLTPDSFYKGSRLQSQTEVIGAIEQMVLHGADIIDMGAVSTRPGADLLNFEEEQKRLIPILKTIRKLFPAILISIDTFRSDIASIAINEGANIINDISGGNMDSKMYDVIAKHKVPYILMHMRGTPKTMQTMTGYDNIVLDVMAYFLNATLRLNALGVEQIILDPGFGFSKKLDGNYRLLQYLNVFKSYGYPLLVGLSRKSMIYKQFDINPEDALPATSALNLAALQNGAKILRVHDVQEAVQVLGIFELLSTP